MKLETMLNKFDKKYFRNILLVFTGTFLSQAIVIGFSPFLTRIYTPENFGVFNLFISIITVGSIFSTGRYEISILQPQNIIESLNLTKLSVLISLGSTVVLSLFLFFIKIEKIDEIKYFIPISVFLTAFYQIILNYLNKGEKYKSISISKFVKSLFLVIFQIGFSFYYLNGLIIGYIISIFISSFYLLIQSKLTFLFFLKFRINELTELLKKYINYPKFSLFADTINSFTNQMPLFFIFLIYGEKEAGFYGLTLRLLGLPLVFISNSILEVFKQNAVNEVQSIGNCSKTFIKTFLILIVISLPIFIVFGFFSPNIFSFLFGNNWINSGHYAQILVFLFFFKFIVSPLSFVLYIYNKQKIDLIWQILLFFVTIIIFFLFSKYLNVESVLMVYSIFYSIMYIVLFFISFKISNLKYGWNH
ncbi:MAG: oligosaccharide flippase family protein [Cytophagaceae bacterium]|nr:oligosaccharide flippase family protein [Cytophagaceae bacterium]